MNDNEEFARRDGPNVRLNVESGDGTTGDSVRVPRRISWAVLCPRNGGFGPLGRARWYVGAEIARAEQEIAKGRTGSA